MQRRTFMGGLAALLGSVRGASPKPAIIPKAAHLGSSLDSLMGWGVGDSSPPITEMDLDDKRERYADEVLAVAKYLQTFGVPDFLYREMIDETMRVRDIDHDIMALRSLSLAAKINLQRERNRAHALDKVMRVRPEREAAKAIWLKATGLKVPHLW